MRRPLPPVEGNRSFSARPRALTTALKSQPAKHFRTTLPSLPTPTDRLAVPSSWAGQLAIHWLPLLWTPFSRSRTAPTGLPLSFADGCGMLVIDLALCRGLGCLLLVQGDAEESCPRRCRSPL